MIFDKKKCWFLVKNIIDFVSILGNLTTQIAIIVIIFIFFSSQLSVFELLKWHTYIIVSSNGLKLQSLSRNMLHLRSKTHVEYLIISISNYSMLNVNNCNNFHNRGSCKFHKGNWLHTVEQRVRGILYKLQIHENFQFELSIKEIQFSLKHYLHKVYIQHKWWLSINSSDFQQ